MPSLQMLTKAAGSPTFLKDKLTGMISDLCSQHFEILQGSFEEMRQYQQKIHKYAQNIRKTRREEIRAEKRVWNQLPSVLIELPSRIENSQWEYYQELLDSIEEHDLQIVDESLTTYIQKKYGEILEKNPDLGSWKDENKLNLIRMVLRLRIADPEQVTNALEVLGELNSFYLVQHSKEVTSSFFKMIKEIAIYLQPTQNLDKLSQENSKLLNAIVSNIKIYRSHFENEVFQDKEIFDNFRIYYVFLVAHQIIDFRGYILSRNIGELYCLINDSLDHRESIEIVLSIDVVRKILALDPNESKQNSICLKGLEVLLIDGLEKAKEFTNSCHHDLPHFNYSGSFFSQLLKIVNNCDVNALIKSIQLLAELFQYSDNYIQAVIKVQHPSKSIQIEDNSERNKNVIKIKRQEFLNYSQFFIFSMSNLLSEVRYKTYWLLSNILGSERFFFSYGLQFVKAIYLQRYIFEESANKHIENQLIICILNFICNLNLEPEAVSALVDIKFGGNQQRQGCYHEGSNRYPDNCFIFCLETTLNLIQQLYNVSELQEEVTTNIKENFRLFFHRSLYALFSIIQSAKGEKGEAVYERTIFQIEKRKIHVYLSSLDEKVIRKGNEWKEEEALMEEILKILESRKQSL